MRKWFLMNWKNLDELKKLKEKWEQKYPMVLYFMASPYPAEMDSAAEQLGYLSFASENYICPAE